MIEVAPLASIVVPTRDRSDLLRRCLSALGEQQTSVPFEVIVIDDGSEVPVEAELPGSRRGEIIRLHGRGPAAARNAGARGARGALLLFTDDDTIPDRLWVESAVRALERTPDAVGVEGPVICPAYDPLFEYSVQNGSPGAYWTCNVAYRAEVLREAGGFSEVFPAPHCEDLDLGFRMLGRGEILFESAMAVTHPARRASVGFLVRRGQLAGSELALAQRHPGKVALPPRLRFLAPAYGRAHHWARYVVEDRRALLRHPRRLGRCLTIAVGQVMLSALAGIRWWAQDRRRG